MKKNLVVLFSLCITVCFSTSCGFNEKKSKLEDSITSIDTSLNEKEVKNNLYNDTASNIDSTIIRIKDQTLKMEKEVKKAFVNSKYYKNGVSKIKRLNSFAQYLRGYFSIGFSKDDVIRIQGFPQSKVQTENEKETWFYGECEINFVKDKVQSVPDEGNCLHFLNLYDFINDLDKSVSSRAQFYFEELII
jgi:hypothetical protein